MNYWLKRAQLLRSRLRLFFLFSLFLFLGNELLYAACPVGTLLKARGRSRTEVPISHTEQSIAEQSVSDDLSLSMPIGNADIDVSQTGLIPVANMSLSKWQWRLHIPRPTTITSSDLIVTYKVLSPDGRQGIFRCKKDYSSIIKVVPVTREVTETVRKNYIIFKGYLDLHVDYSDAKRSGIYEGIILVTVDCP